MSILTVGGKVVLAGGKPIIPPQGGELPQQEKSVTITKNGQTSVTPDDGKTLSKVDVTVAVPSDAKPEQTKTARITANGTTKVLPDSGKVLSEVDVTVAVPSDAKAEEEKTVSITENGTTEITPTSGKVLSKATVNVNVPQPDIGELKVTANGTYTAGKDVDAWSKVTVNVPQSGGTVTPVDPGDITFYDYDGTVVAAWTLAELASKTALPDYPTHDGLTCQGWNWTLAELKAQNTKMNVGAMYVTDDDTARIYISLQEGRTSPMLGCGVYGTVTVDWGDGTEPDTLTGTNINSTKWTPTHNYASPGDYKITLTKGANSAIAFSGSATANQYAEILRHASAADVRNLYYLNAVQKIELCAGVTLRSRACFYLQNLKSITLPKGTNFNAVLFQNCANLKHITWPADQVYISNDVLRACSGMKTLSLPNKMGSFSTSVFLGCTMLENIYLPKGMTAFNSYDFRDCVSLINITIPSGVSSISKELFRGCGTMRVYDFAAFEAVPTLASTDAFTGIASDCEIRVPASLVDTWKAATNWATYADHIVGV